KETQLGWVVISKSKEKIAVLKSKVILETILLITLFSIITFFLIWFLSRYFTKPVYKIRSGVNKLTHGNLNTKIEPIKLSEFNKIAEGINKLGATIKNLQNDLHSNIEQSTTDLRQNLEAVEMQNIELDISLKNAQKVNQKKSEFIANLSHEV